MKDFLIRNNYYVKLKNEKWYVVVNDFLIGKLNSMKLSDYDDELRYKDDKYSFLDVAEVRDCNVVVAGVCDEEAIIRNKLLWESPTSAEREFEKMHRAMWNDIADGKVFDKTDWVKLFGSDNVFMDCYACEEAYRRKNEKGEDIFGLCKYCPITPKGHPDCCSGLYHEWWREDDKDRARELAREIANLEWR